VSKFGIEITKTTIQGDNLEFDTASTSRMAIDNTGIVSVATDSFKIGNVYAMASLDTAAVSYATMSFATVTTGNATAAITFSPAFPNSFGGAICNTDAAYVHAHVGAGTGSVNGVTCYLDDPAPANVRVYWTAWGK
jgi:hypothetical protein